MPAVGSKGASTRRSASLATTLHVPRSILPPHWTCTETASITTATESSWRCPDASLPIRIGLDSAHPATDGTSRSIGTCSPVVVVSGVRCSP